MPVGFHHTDSFKRFELAMEGIGCIAKYLDVPLLAVVQRQWMLRGKAWYKGSSHSLKNSPLCATSTGLFMATSEHLVGQEMKAGGTAETRGDNSPTQCVTRPRSTELNVYTRGNRKKDAWIETLGVKKLTCLWKDASSRRKGTWSLICWRSRTPVKSSGAKPNKVDYQGDPL